MIGRIKSTVSVLLVFALFVTLSVTVFSEEAYAAPVKKEYYGKVYYKTVKGYAGKQDPGGTRFRTGGGFYYSDKGGPVASASVSLGAGYGVASVGVSLGVSSGKGSSGIFVKAPDKKNKYKLYIEKTLKCRNYKVLVKK